MLCFFEWWIGLLKTCAGIITLLNDLVYGYSVMLIKFSLVRLPIDFSPWEYSNSFESKLEYCAYFVNKSFLDA